MNTAPIIMNNNVFNGVTIPSSAITAPTIYNTLGMPKSCPTSTEPKSAFLEPLVTKIPVDNDIKREGI